MSSMLQKFIIVMIFISYVKKFFFLPIYELSIAQLLNNFFIQKLNKYCNKYIARC